MRQLTRSYRRWRLAGLELPNLGLSNLGLFGLGLSGVGLLGVALLEPAAAQQPSQAQVSAIKQSCRSDYQSYCSSVPTGGQAALQCLQEHLASLSSACQSAVSASTGNAHAAAPATGQQAPAPHAAQPRQQAALLRRFCGADFRTYCRGVPLGGGRGIACLAENQSRLSPGCRSTLAEMHGAR